jgi:actin-like ATPase involved in cell morphogenesis
MIARPRQRRAAPPAPRFDIYVHHSDRAELRELRNIIHQLREDIMTALSELQAEVAETGTVVDSAVTLLQGLKAQLDEAIASGDPAALQALSKDLDAKTHQLAAAVAENTPADPDVPADPPTSTRSKR